MDRFLEDYIHARYTHALILIAEGMSNGEINRAFEVPNSYILRHRAKEMEQFLVDSYTQGFIDRIPKKEMKFEVDPYHEAKLLHVMIVLSEEKFYKRAGLRIGVTGARIGQLVRKALRTQFYRKDLLEKPRWMDLDPSMRKHIDWRLVTYYEYEIAKYEHMAFLYEEGLSLREIADRVDDDDTDWIKEMSKLHKGKFREPFIFMMKVGRLEWIPRNSHRN